MRQRVEDLRTGKRSLPVTIDNLSALVWELQESPEEWRQRYIEAWSDLEVPYAIALAEDQPIPTRDDPSVIQALAELDALLDERQQSA